MLTAANAVQAKTGSLVAGNPAVVALDDPTQEGNTVTIELHGGGAPITQLGTFPVGWELDANSRDTNTINLLHVFRKRQVTGGEQSWNFGYISANNWAWRVTEWDAELEPMSPLEGITAFATSGTGPATLSTGTTQTASRPGLVCLAWHHWQRAAATAQAMTFSGHTNGFTIRDELRFTAGVGAEFAECWSWAFSDVPDAFETTATINLTTRSAVDLYVAQMVVYAAITYG
jgi:hypothetical protein